jgi:hypothetical protein
VIPRLALDRVDASQFSEPISNGRNKDDVSFLGQVYDRRFVPFPRTAIGADIADCAAAGYKRKAGPKGPALSYRSG